MNKLMLASMLSGLTLIGCGQPAEEDNPDIDQALVTEYRAALPSMSELAASAPEASAAATQGAVGKALGEPALYPQGSYDIATGINGAVSGIVQVMGEVVDLPPTVYNSDTKELVWGPFPNEDGIGYVAAYIRDAGEDDDFRYHYALLRGIDNDLASMTPVIWGGATPDPDNEDHGAGVTLWDFEANHAFEEEHNPDHDSLALDRGRFVALYARGFDEGRPSAEAAFVVAAFRDFVPQDQPDSEPADLDYFYGRYVDGVTVDFLDWQAAIDVSDPADGVAENVGVRMAFLNEGTGRAEADAVGGSLEDNQRVEAIECWNAAIEQRYLRFELLTDGTTELADETGDAADCGLFTASLDELGVPSLDDVDAELLQALDQVARNGIPAE